MGKTYICPFYAWEEKLAVHCEMAHVKFPDKAVRDEYLGRYCSALPGWRGCTLARQMNLYYERMEDDV